MADNDVRVSFTGDVSPMRSAMDAASSSVKDATASMRSATAPTQAAFDKLAASMNRLAEESQKTSAAAESLDNWLVTWPIRLKIAEYAFDGLAGAAKLSFQGIGLAASGTVGGINLLTRASQGLATIIINETKDWIDFAKSIAYAQTPLGNMAKVINDLPPDRFLGFINPIRTLADTIEYAILPSLGRFVLQLEEGYRKQDIFTSGLVAATAEAIAATGAMDSFVASVGPSKFENANAAILAFTTQLTRIPGVTNEIAATMEAQLGGVTDSTVQLNQSFVDLVTHLTDTAAQATDLATKISAAFTIPKTFGNALLTSLKGVTAETERQFEIDKLSNNQHAMTSTLINAIADAEQKRANERGRALTEAKASYANLNWIQQLFAHDLEREISDLQQGKTQIDAQVQSVRDLANQWRSVVDGTEATAKSAEDIVKALNPLSRQLDDAIGKQKTLQRAFGGEGYHAPDQTEALQKQNDKVFELQQAKDGITKEDQLQLDAQKQKNAEDKDELKSAEAALDIAKKGLEIANDQLKTGQKSNLSKKELFDLDKRVADRTASVDAAEVAVAEKKYNIDVARLEAKQKLARTPELKTEAAKEIHEKQAEHAEGTGDTAGKIRAEADAAKDSMDAADRVRDKRISDENDAYKFKLEKLQELKIEEEEEAQLSINVSASKLAAEKKYIDAKKSLEDEHFSFQMSQYRKDEDAYGKALAQKNLLQEKANIELQKATRTANQELLQSYRSAFEGVGNVISGDIMGIIEHTKKLKDVWSDVAKHIVSTMLNAGIKLVADWAAKQAFLLTSTIATQTGITGVITSGAAAQAAAADTGVASYVAAALAKVMAGAATTGAEVSAFVAPLVGPAAPAIGATAQAAVIASGTGILADVGAWKVDKDQPAFVHKNEMIMNPQQGEAFRNLVETGGSGGSTNHTWNVSAVDAPSFIRMLNDHASPLTKAVQRMMNSNPSLRPSF